MEAETQIGQQLSKKKLNLINEDKIKTGSHSGDLHLSKHTCRRLGAKPSQEREQEAGRAEQQSPPGPPDAEEKHKTENQ